MMKSRKKRSALTSHDARAYYEKIIYLSCS